MKDVWWTDDIRGYNWKLAVHPTHPRRFKKVFETDTETPNSASLSENASFLTGRLVCRGVQTPISTLRPR